MQVYPAFLKFETHLKIEVPAHRHSAFSWNIEVQSKISPRRYDGICFEIWLTAAHMLRFSPIHIDHTGETATDSVTLGQHFYQNCYINKKNQGIHWSSVNCPEEGALVTCPYGINLTLVIQYL